MKYPVIPARPTVYKGIRMRSRLEADYASALDRDGETWEYEPTCFGAAKGQWLPDFRISADGIYVEVKPAYLMAYDGPSILDTYDRVDKILKRMTVAWESEPDAHLMLVFWIYGLEQVEAPLSILGSKGSAGWAAYTPGTVDLPLLWPGMGQTETLVKTNGLMGGGQ
jgi:hypothetical protein